MAEGRLHNELRAIWSEALEVPFDEVDLDTTFLDLGGESISAMLCVNRVLRTFGVDISAKSLLTEEFSVRRLAAAIAQPR
jgi:acyl carrier protein